MDSILSDEPSVHSLPDSAESESPAPVESTGSEVKVADKGEKPAPVTAKAKEAAPTVAAVDDDSDDGAVPDNLDGLKKALAASRGDKRKARKQWQEAREQLARLEGEIGQLRKQHQPTKAEAPQGPAEPTEAELEAEYWANPVAFVRKYGQPKVDPVEVATRTKIEISVYHAKKAHADYDEKLEAFRQAAESAPHLWDMANKSPDPGGFVYDHGAQLLDVGQYADLNAWREAERAKLRAEMEAEFTTSPQEATHPSARPPIPKSNAGSRGTGASAKQAWSGPRSLDDILA